jgi:acetolactate synthase-1/2/3 large subunit
MPVMTGAQALIEQLLAEQVDTMFALPGVQIMNALDAVYEHRNAINLIHTRHEQATTYMADGYAKATGKVGVAMVVPGPGALNAASGLGTAYASSSPVLMISGQIDSNSLGKRLGDLHEIDEQLDVFAPITKWNHRVASVAEIPEAVHEAFRQLTTGRPRPVELELPPDILAASAEVTLLDAETYAAPAGDAGAIGRAAAFLLKAERPVIVAGGGTLDASAELIALAEWLQAPVIMTQQGKGVIPDDHPLSLGVDYVVGPLKESLASSDAILAVGTRLHIREYEPGALPPLVHIDIDASEIGKTFTTEVGIVADARAALIQLLERLRDSGPARPSRGDAVTAQRQAFRDRMRAMTPDQSAIIDTLRAELDDDAILISGVTNIGYWSNVLYPAMQPRGTITSGYFGTLGFAFPTALGAKVACPGRQVVALCGDGGFMFSPQEFSTAMRYGINLVAIVFNNNAYGASRWDQIHRFNERFIATDLYNPDFVKLAEAFGAIGMRCDPAGLGAALKQALVANAPVLLEVEVPIMMPPFQIIS